jgi:hypothetical protein
LEELATWPGHYTFEVGAYAERFSLGGVLWLPFALIGAVGLAREGWRSFPVLRLSGRSWVLITMLPLFLGLVFLVRWMGGAAERYWICAYALSLPITGSIAGGWCGRRRGLAIVALALLAYAAWPALVVHARAIPHWHEWTRATSRLDEPFEEIVSGMEPGARILLVASQNGRDYPLFLPRRGYPNALYSWGKSAPDPERLDRLIAEYAITDVVFENDHGVSLQWDGSVQTGSLVKRMAARRDFVSVPIVTPGERWFHLGGLPAAAPTAAPAFAGWDKAEGLDRQEGPYPESGLPVVRWGLGEQTRLAFSAAGAARGTLALECRRNNDPAQTLSVILNGECLLEHTFGVESDFVRFDIPLTLRPGANELVLRYKSAETVAGRRERRLAVLFRRLQIVRENAGAPAASPPLPAPAAH